MAASEQVVLIHGMWCGAWCWDGFRRVLEDAGHRCTVPTLPYHDADPRAEPDPRLGTTSLLDYAAALESDIRAINAPVVLVGHSMGGLLAQMLASRLPVRGLVLLAPAGMKGVYVYLPSVIRSFLSVQLRPDFFRVPMRQRFPEAAWSMLHLMPEAEQRAIYARFVHESGRAAAEIAYSLLDPRRASQVDVERIGCPVRMMVGWEDRITPPWTVWQAARRYRGRARLDVLPGHAHWLLGEPGWEALAGEVTDWLGALPA